jgi:hypothetical protein
MTGKLRHIAAVLIGVMTGWSVIGMLAVSAAPGQLAIAYNVDPAPPVVGLPVSVTATVSAVGGPLSVALVDVFPVTATADGTGQTVTATVTAGANGQPATYTGILTFPAPGIWHISAPNWQGAQGNDLAVTVSDITLDGVPRCHANDTDYASQWDAAVGNRYGTVTVTKRSAGACVLSAYPDIQIEDGQEHLVVSRSDTTGGQDAGGDTVITPGQQAQFVARWVNLCPQATQGASYNLRVFLSGDANDSFTVPASAPPCLGETQPSLLTEQPFTLQGDAIQTLRDYFMAINNRQYDAAYALFGTAMRQQNPSQSAFAAGFALTTRDDLHVIAASPNDGQTVVAILLTARQRDGAFWYFHGTYTIGMEDGARKILAANIMQGWVRAR